MALEGSCLAEDLLISMDFYHPGSSLREKEAPMQPVQEIERVEVI